VAVTAAGHDPITIGRDPGRVNAVTTQNTELPLERGCVAGATPSATDQSLRLARVWLSNGTSHAALVAAGSHSAINSPISGP
jgi:hypothetical protein